MSYTYDKDCLPQGEWHPIGFIDDGTIATIKCPMCKGAGVFTNCENKTVHCGRCNGLGKLIIPRLESH